MPGDQFQDQIDWIKSLSGDSKVDAGTVVAWYAVTMTLKELIDHFNTITFNSAQGDMKRYREVQLKKVIIGMLYEMDGCLKHWAGLLHKKGKLDNGIVQKRKDFETECKKVGFSELKDIRNGVAFHFTDYLTEPDAIVDTYTKIDEISLSSINAILRTAIDCGEAMKQKVSETIN